MKKIHAILLMCFALIASVHAEVIVLRSGQKVKGDILFQNEEVMIIRKKDGSRYQFPASEILRVETNAQDEHDDMEKTASAVRVRKVDCYAAVDGGAAYLPYHGWGGTARLELMLGSHNLLGKRIFLGGSVGYQASVYADKNYHWIPLQLVAQVPILREDKRWYPKVGVNVGYAFATNKEWGGGMCAGVNVGCGYDINQRSSLLLAVVAGWQQTRINTIETINGTAYQNYIGCSQLHIGARVGIQF